MDSPHSYSRAVTANMPSPVPPTGHPRMPAPSIQTTIGFVPTLHSPLRGAPSPGQVNVLVPRSAKKSDASRAPAWGTGAFGVPTPPPTAANSMEGFPAQPDARGSTHPASLSATTPWQGQSGNTPWKQQNGTPWSVGSAGSGISAGSFGSPGTTPWSTLSNAPTLSTPWNLSRTPATPSTASTLSGSPAVGEGDNPWPSNRYGTPKTDSPLFDPQPFPLTPTPPDNNPFSFPIPAYARPARVLVPDPNQLSNPGAQSLAPERRTIDLVCSVQVSRTWLANPPSAAALGPLRSYFTAFPPPNLDLYPASLPDGTHVLGMLPAAFWNLKVELENQIGLQLPSIPPSKVEVMVPVHVFSGPLNPAGYDGGFRREPPYIPGRRFRSPDEYERYAASFVSGHNRNLAQQRRRHDAYLHSLRHLLHSHHLLRRRQARLIALDIEAWEHDHSLLLEIGYTTAAFRPAPGVGEGGDGVWIMKGHHLVVEENAGRRNGMRVEDNRDGFLFGTTQVLPLKKCLAKLRTALRGADYVVAHAAHSDEKFLRRHGLGFSGKPVLDTQIMVKCLRGTTEQLRLSRVLDELGMRNYRGLHNAGNDAYYTMEACLRMGRGPPPPREVAKRLGIDWQRVVSRERDREAREREAWGSSPSIRGPVPQGGSLVANDGDGALDPGEGPADDHDIGDGGVDGADGAAGYEELPVDDGGNDGEVQEEANDEDVMDVDG
ncbi:hypothetical protein DFJ74DRAFT_691621 [Hyaloraphidium curvatum]|nr:hypothetical protein DFJ74DRAFT_691621 [Hyaloraphidium curvatum]